MDAELLAFVAEVTGATRATHDGRIQSLWGGYGELLRVRLVGCARETAIVKWAKPPPRPSNPESHARKCRSYDVETAFYRDYASLCGEARVATCLGLRHRHGSWILVLEDLDDAGYPRRQRDPRGEDLAACLAWLAAFHARFLGAKPIGLWKSGTYWHLATRREELAAARDPSLEARAIVVDDALRAARHQTLVHGDAKPANFCFGARGAGVAAVDFQYVGGGPGIKDVAYLLHGASRAAQEQAKGVYFARLRAALPAEVEGEDVEHEWRTLYPTAIEDFERFLVGWRG